MKGEIMQLEPLPRRKFLKLGLMIGGCAMAALNGYASTTFAATESDPPSYGVLLVLNQDQANVMNAFAEAVLPQGESFPSAMEASVVKRLDEELFFISAYIADDVKLALGALEMMPISFGYSSRFSRLSARKRLAFLNQTKETDSDLVRAVINNCRMICFNLYYGHESTWAAIGYDGVFSQIPQKAGAQRRYYATQTHAGPIKG